MAGGNKFGQAALPAQAGAAPRTPTPGGGQSYSYPGRAPQVRDNEFTPLHAGTPNQQPQQQQGGPQSQAGAPALPPLMNQGQSPKPPNMIDYLPMPPPMLNATPPRRPAAIDWKDPEMVKRYLRSLGFQGDASVGQQMSPQGQQAMQLIEMQRQGRQQ